MKLGFSIQRNFKGVCNIALHKNSVKTSPSLASSILDSCITTSLLQEIAQGIQAITNRIKLREKGFIVSLMSGQTQQIYQETEEQRHVRAGL